MAVLGIRSSVPVRTAVTVVTLHRTRRAARCNVLFTQRRDLPAHDPAPSYLAATVPVRRIRPLSPDQFAMRGLVEILDLHVHGHATVVALRYHHHYREAGSAEVVHDRARRQPTSHVA